jgi:hypothetical protein
MKMLKKRENIMGLKGLAEGIILQSIEDLWAKDHKEDCISFFKGEGFRDCARMARMSTSDQIKLLNLVRNIIENQRQKRKLKLKSSGQPMGRQELRKTNLISII